MLESSQLQTIKQRFDIVGNTPDLDQAIRVAVQVAPTDLPVLITGESGVGKENFPKIIHQYSVRKHEKYIAVNCGAIPEGTMDSELFGHEKGSFTGALTDRRGYFEVADGGTIFLDEVGELPLPTQARLLRVLQDGEFFRVGSSEVKKTNVRVVAATNINIQQAIREGKFRGDLYYRLNAVPIQIPPLRERKTDIMPLFTKFANDFAETYRRPPVKLTAEAQKMLVNYYWQGNIRQLKNVAEQISAVETNPEIEAATLIHYLPDESQSRLPLRVSNEKSERTFNNEREILYQVLFDMKKDMDELKKSVSKLMTESDSIVPKEPKPVQHHEQTVISYTPTSIRNEDYEDAQEYEESPLAVDDMEKELIKKALEKHAGKRKYAAMDLKISERTLYRKIKEYGLDNI
ncbi:MAG: sigma-54-dependent Fis family transcriptional regulator [Bacteroidia bacterium]|nr:sigma-54-dependent Fis family transcriptional regulator [Bacteroidia bacterium]